LHFLYLAAYFVIFNMIFWKGQISSSAILKDFRFCICYFAAQFILLLHVLQFQ